MKSAIGYHGCYCDNRTN